MARYLGRVRAAFFPPESQRFRDAAGFRARSHTSPPRETPMNVRTKERPPSTTTPEDPCREVPELHRREMDRGGEPAPATKTGTRRHDDLIGTFPARPDRRRARRRVGGKGFEAWSRVPAPKRGEVLKRAGDIMTLQKEELADGMTREMGNPWSRPGATSGGDRHRYYAASEGRRLFSHTAPPSSATRWASRFAGRAGSSGSSPTWNFPWPCPAGRSYGPCCGDASSGSRPGHAWTAVQFVEIRSRRAPPDAIQLLTGFGSEVGAPICLPPQGAGHLVHPARPRSAGDRRRLRRDGEAGLARDGRKNAQLVMDDANLDLAIEGVLWGVRDDRSALHRDVAAHLLTTITRDGRAARPPRREAQARRRAEEGTRVGAGINEDSRDKVGRCTADRAGRRCQDDDGWRDPTDKGPRGVVLQADDIHRRPRRRCGSRRKRSSARSYRSSA